jgi:hypothetical protein
VTNTGFAIRAPGNRPWLLLFVIGCGFLALTVLNLTSVRPGQTAGYVALGCCYVPLVWAIRSVGVDLTSESVIVRDFPRRTVPWADVNAVVSQVGWSGTSSVRLVLDSGDSVTLPYPRTVWCEGNAQFERDLRRIEGCWRAWAPASVEKRVTLDDLVTTGADSDR